VRAINGTQIQVYDIAIQTVPDEPMLKILKVGDYVRIRGGWNSAGQLAALQIANVVDPTSTATVLVDGPAQAIQGNVVTVNGINVTLAPDNPTLKGIQVGKFLSITGNFERQGQTITLIVVTVVIIDDANIPAYLQCKEKKAMGMGMSAPPPPGMGDDGMGMGMGMGMGTIDCP